MSLSTAPSSPRTQFGRGLANKFNQDRSLTFSDSYSQNHKHHDYSKSASAMASVRTSEETLDDDNPEDRRIAAAILRRHVTFKDQRQRPKDDATAVDSPEPPPKRSCRVCVGPSSPSSDQSCDQDCVAKTLVLDSQTEDDNADDVTTAQFSSRSRSCISTPGSRFDEDDDDDDVLATAGLQTRSRSCVLTPGPRADDENEGQKSRTGLGRGIGDNGSSECLFWGELEGLKEENVALRHESEVHRLRGQATALKLQLQELVNAMLYRAAFGFHSFQVDLSIQEVLDDSWRRGVQRLDAEFDIPAFVFQYSHAPSDLVWPTTNDESGLHSLSRELEAMTITENPSHGGSCCCGCGHDRRCSVIGLSRAAEFLTGRRLVDAQGTSWRSLFASDSPTDKLYVFRVKKWLDGIKQRMQTLSLKGDLSFIEEHLLEDSEFVSPIRLRHRSGRSVPGTLLLSSIFVANRLLILGTHSSSVHLTHQELATSCNSQSQTSQSQISQSQSQSSSAEAEIRVRKSHLAVFSRVCHSVIDTLKTAQNLLTRSGTGSVDFTASTTTLDSNFLL